MRNTSWSRVAALGAAAGVSACTQMGLQPGAESEAGGMGAAGGACGADALQDLVGTSIGALDASALPENRRVIFPGMAVTEDYKPGRLNVEVGADDEVQRVYCG